MKLYFEVFDYFSLFSHLLRYLVCDLCLIWWWGVTYNHCVFSSVYFVTPKNDQFYISIIRNGKY